ncbi:MAG: hypothetical protein NTZ78_00555 [Candidatus Aureabacteria bacterium]|nr:hypothetical protein [Candidatus Auribacterota bacterium]
MTAFAEDGETSTVTTAIAPPEDLQPATGSQPTETIPGTTAGELLSTLVKAAPATGEIEQEPPPAGSGESEIEKIGAGEQLIIPGTPETEYLFDQDDTESGGFVVPEAAQADLTPYLPGYWNDKIPIGISQLAAGSTHSYSGPYYNNQTLYFNWGSNNQGSAAASGYTVHFEVSGTGGGSWNWTSQSTNPGYWNYLTNDQAVGPLSAGSHTFKLWLDYNGNVSESNETNNYYERTITVSAPSQADLTPYQPGMWNDKIPIGITQLSYSATHSYTGPYYNNQTLYFNWASYNQGSATASGYTVHFEVSGTGGGSWNWSSLSTPATQYTCVTNDQAVGPLSAGSHTFKVWVDYNGNVSESNESNNYYERTITVSAPSQPNLKPYQPSGCNGLD